MPSKREKARFYQEEEEGCFWDDLQEISTPCGPCPGRKSRKNYTQQQTTGTRPHWPVRVKGGGHGFETHLAALIGLRGLKMKDNFQLFSNKYYGDTLYDLVYTAGGRRYFLQLKHADFRGKQNRTKVEMLALLKKSFKSYCDVKHGKDFSDIPVDKTEFIIYTATKPDPNLSQLKNTQTSFDVYFKKRSQNVRAFNFISEENRGFHLSSDRELAREFFKRVVIVVSQGGKSQLDNEISMEIQEDAMKFGREMCTAEIFYLKTRVEIFLKNRKNIMTAEMFKNWLQEAKTEACRQLLSGLSESFKEKFLSTGIQFADSEISRLKAELSYKPAVHLRSDAPALCSILLMQCLPVTKCICVNFESLEGNKSKLLNAWLEGDCPWLVVSCDSNIQETLISDICRDIFITSTKNFILLTSFSVKGMKGFCPIDHKFEFKHLSQESRKMVLDKTLDFQGHELTVGSLLHRHGIMGHDLGAGMISRLVTEEIVMLGGTLPANRGYYAPRVLEKEVWLQLDVLRNPDSYPDMFAVSGMEVKDLVSIVPSGETVEYIEEQNKQNRYFMEKNRSRFFVLSEKGAEICFLELCKTNAGRTLHCVQFKDGNLLWKKTHGELYNLLNYIDTERTRLDKMRTEKYIARKTCEVSEDLIWDLGERTVLVVAEPGMGKSSTTTQVAWNTKKRHPTCWVVHINWSNHSRKLQEISAETFNSNLLVEFLCCATFPDSDYTDINRSLLTQALQKFGNITVLMDGFDELSAIHADKAAVILSELMKTKARRVWVTSRPEEKERLEKMLSVNAFSMKELSHQFQAKILLELWMSKKNQDKETCVTFVNEVLMLANQSVKESSFTGSPLCIKMIAKVYARDIKKWIRSGFSKFPPDFDVVRFYEKYIERELHSYLTQKEQADIKNDSVMDRHECLEERLLEYFENCALVAILPSPMIKLLHDKKVEEKAQQFVVKLHAGEDKKGELMNLVHGQPKFVHPSLAEYFTARWFSRNLEFNRSVLELILFDPRYSSVSHMFDRMLVKGCPLHFAVLERDKKSFKSLLEKCDVSTLDKGGRTVMHIIATRDCTFMGTIDRVLRYKATLHKPDRVLQWTPLQYAIKSEKWLVVERLLARKVDRSGLDMIRQRAQDPDYIDPIIIHAATCGYLSLLEFLYSVGVNIHQASSTDFPSPLHAAIQAVKLPVVKWLIQHGADCNTRYSDGKTPLFHAVTKGCIDVVRALVEEGSASPDVRDDEDRTVTDWVMECASDPKELDDIVWKGDVERLNEIVKYLQERGVKGSAVCG